MKRLIGFLVAALLMPTGVNAEIVLVTGSNRGIGLEFVKQYAAIGWTVIATHRRDAPPETLVEVSNSYPGQILIENMDVSSHAQILALAEKLKGVPIDLIINNAALISSFQDLTAHSFGTLEHEQFDQWMKVNAPGLTTPGTPKHIQS